MSSSVMSHIHSFTLWTKNMEENELSTKSKQLMISDS